MSNEYEMSEEVRSLEQQLDCATEYCRQFSLEIKKLKERVEELESQLSAVPTQVSTNEQLQAEVKHWKANHADLKERLHVATHRTDLPSDRLPLFDKMKAENFDLKLKVEVYEAGIKLLENIKQENAALLNVNEQQAKRIADLEAQIPKYDIEAIKTRLREIKSHKELPPDHVFISAQKGTE